VRWVAVGATIFLAACSSGRADAPTAGADGAAVEDPAPGVSGELAEVASITDGDTFRTADGDRVRLIGIDTPEVDQDACFADEATDALADLIPPGTAVRLVLDVEVRDRFGRLLAYVERAEDGLFVNEELARQGFALQLTVPPNVARAEELGAAVAEAREEGRGLWSACGERQSAVPSSSTTTSSSSTTTTTAPPSPVRPVVPTVPPAPPAVGTCHPSYPTVCIPPAPPDLDCPQIPHRRFTVVGDDPHGFDGDDDGLGCES
jgi:micrococcal nuclease